MRAVICIFSLLVSFALAQQNNNQDVSGETLGKSAPTLLNITNGDDFLALLAYTGVTIDIVEVKEKETIHIDYSNRVMEQLTGKMTASGSRSGDKINIVLAYTGGNGNGKLVVIDATINLEISTTVPIFSDYWRLSKATMDMNYSVDGETSSIKGLDITPRFGYSNQPADLQCGAGYSVCAPRHLSWSCGNNHLMKANKTGITVGSKTPIVSMQNLFFHPFAKGAPRIRFGANWDCDPLIPISLWSSILVSLGLATIVVWSLSMVGAVYTPSKFDDPKGPALMIAQTD